MKLYRTFLKIGCTGFGGPVATMAMMREASKKLNWMSEAEFDVSLALCKLLPGPAAFKLAALIGYQKKGILAGIITGTLFTIPAVLLVGLAAWFTKTYGSVAWLDRFNTGMRPAVMAVILHSLYVLLKGRWNLKETWLVLGLSCAVHSFWLAGEPLWILLFGLGGVGFWYFKKNKLNLFIQPFAIAPFLTTEIDWDRIKVISITCLSAGAFIFGSGLAIVPVLESDFVTKYSYVSRAVFADSLSWGFVTPGPIVTSATYLGFHAAGFWGASAATLFIFLPSLVYAFAFAPFAIKLLKGAWSRAFIETTLPCIVGAIVIASRGMFIESVSGVAQACLFIVALAVCFWEKVPAWAVLFSAGGIGIILFS